MASNVWTDIADTDIDADSPLKEGLGQDITDNQRSLVTDDLNLSGLATKTTTSTSYPGSPNYQFRTRVRKGAENLVVVAELKIGNAASTVSCKFRIGHKDRITTDYLEEEQTHTGDTNYTETTWTIDDLDGDEDGSTSWTGTAEDLRGAEVIIGMFLRTSNASHTAECRIANRSDSYFAWGSP